MEEKKQVADYWDNYSKSPCHSAYVAWWYNSELECGKEYVCSHCARQLVKNHGQFYVMECELNTGLDNLRHKMPEITKFIKQISTSEKEDY